MDIDWMLTDEMRSLVEPLGGLLCIQAHPEYRCANMRIGDGWFSEGAQERRIALVHEVLHLHIETLSVVLEDLISATDPPEPLAKWAKEQWRRAEEGVICDLSRRIVAVRG